MYYTGMPNGTFAPVAIPGHVPPPGILSTPGLVARSTRLPIGVENHLAMKLAITTFQRLHQKVTLINLPEFDWPLGHVLGGSRDPATVRKLMQGFDRDLAALQDTYRRSGVLDRTLFVLTADHGTSAVYHTVDKADLTNAVARAGTSIVSDTYHTGAYLWIRDKSRAASAAANIARLQNPNIQAVYFKERIPGGSHYIRASGPDLFRASGMEQANQYLLRTFNGPNGPDLAVFFRQGAASLPGGQASWKGDHGGADWESQHLPLVFSGPGVSKGYVSPFPARLIDIAPTVLALVGVPRTGMDGTTLADAIKGSSAAAQRLQRTKQAEIQPIVSALKAQSRD
jgi:arylsulfatase A-like enzyme